MPEKEININKKNHYVELGEIPDFGSRLGKHQRIQILEEAGLEIPETLVLGPNSQAEKENFQAWCQKCKDNNLEFMVRTDDSDAKIARYMPAIRDANSDVDSLWQKAQEFLATYSQGIIIIQGSKVNIINNDILSANIQFERSHAYGDMVNSKIEAIPDIAPLINRLQLKPAFTIATNKNEIKDIEIHNTENLWGMILYRVGREELRKVRKDLPNIENLPDNYKRIFKDIIEVGKNALKNTPDKYPAPAYWYNNVLNGDLNGLHLPENLATLMLSERARIISMATNLRNPLSNFESCILKMSFIVDAQRNTITPMYWDIIEDTRREYSK